MSEFPRRLKRSESFVGIHFDFHARKDCTQVGKTVTLQMLRDMLALTKPDYVQCDCKGHPGYASYPTKVGTPSPGFTQDPLKLWRQATAEAGVSLYMHYSGVIDEVAVEQHPDWASLDAEGNPQKNGSTSVFGPYVDELLIPMFRELVDEYQVDGVWIDGECWGLEMDYSTHALKAWEQATGKDTMPTSPDDADWFACQEFHRQGFRDYVAHYLAEMHRSHPDFEIASNWAYSGHMPEKAELAVDFISGDVTPANGFNRACLEARIMEGQPRPWDLMAWSFNGQWGKGDATTKSPVQLYQEAAAVLTMGGGFQAYFTQKRDGSIFEWQMDIARQMIAFCRERQAYSHRATPVPQVGLILSSETYYRQPERLFCPWGGFYTAMEGNLRTLLDNQVAVQTPMPWELEEDINRYPLLVFAEWAYCDDALKAQLIQYVKDGGNLLVIGPKAVAHFADELGVSDLKDFEEPKHFVQSDEGAMGNFMTPACKVSLADDVEATHWFHPRNEPWDPISPACSIRQLGKGQIAGVYMDMGQRYIKARTHVARQVIGDLLKRLLPEPKVSVTGSHKVDVGVSTLDGKLLVHLVNTLGPHPYDESYTYDEVPPLGPLTVSVRLDARPTSVTVQPGDVTVTDYAYADGVLKMMLPRLELYDIVVIEP